jgi:hypothetical protein
VERAGGVGAEGARPAAGAIATVSTIETEAGIDVGSPLGEARPRAVREVRPNRGRLAGEAKARGRAALGTVAAETAGAPVPPRGPVPARTAGPALAPAAAVGLERVAEAVGSAAGVPAADGHARERTRAKAGPRRARAGTVEVESPPRPRSSRRHPPRRRRTVCTAGSASLQHKFSRPRWRRTVDAPSASAPGPRPSPRS